MIQASPMNDKNRLPLLLPLDENEIRNTSRIKNFTAHRSLKLREDMGGIEILFSD
jgi:hypothetical protein